MGSAADLLVRHGGTAVLSETPEIYRAEHGKKTKSESLGIGDNEFVPWQIRTVM
jgi:altronate hydrolase